MMERERNTDAAGIRGQAEMCPSCPDCASRGIKIAAGGWVRGLTALTLKLNWIVTPSVRRLDGSADALRACLPSASACMHALHRLDVEHPTIRTLSRLWCCVAPLLPPTARCEPSCGGGMVAQLPGFHGTGTSTRLRAILRWLIPRSCNEASIVHSHEPRKATVRSCD